MKEKLTMKELAEKASCQAEAIKAAGGKPTVECLARALKVRRTDLSRALKEAGVATAGLKARSERLAGRAITLPRIELVGLHAQGCVRKATAETGKELIHSMLVAFVFASRGFPKWKQSIKKREPIEEVLAPSFVSSDKMRLVRFETLFSCLISQLDDPHHPELDPTSMLKEIEESLEIAQAGYDTHVILHATGNAQEILDNFKDRIPTAGEKITWEASIEHLMAEVSIMRDVSCLGPGHFPLMGSTLAKLEQAVSSKEHRSSFHLRWGAEDIDSALRPRMTVSDALCRKGALIGAPPTKLGEMGRYGETSMTHEILVRDSLYGDGVEKPKKTKPLVGLATPTVLPQKLLTQLDADWEGEPPFIEMKTLPYEGGKEIETLVAWLPDVRDHFSHCTKQARIGRLHKTLIAAQTRALQQLPDTPHRECCELINPEGTFQMGPLRDSVVSHDGRKIARRLTLGLVLIAYDSDMLLGHLLGKEAKSLCRKHQVAWHSLLIGTLEQNSNRERILALSANNHYSSAEEALNNYLCHIKQRGSRLIRFVIEQAAVNFSKRLLLCARRLGIDGQAWSEPEAAIEALPVVIEEMGDYWPAVGIRVDYLLRHAASQINKRAIYRWKKEVERRETSYDDDSLLPYRTNDDSKFGLWNADQNLGKPQKPD